VIAIQTWHPLYIRALAPGFDEITNLLVKS